MRAHEAGLTPQEEERLGHRGDVEEAHAGNDRRKFRATPGRLTQDPVVHHLDVAGDPETLTFKRYACVPASMWTVAP
jgi:hypothetical protein